MNPKLSSKAKILVAIPLSVQIISVLVLNLMLDAAERETARIQISREIANESLLVAKKIYDAEYALYSYMEGIKNSSYRNPVYAASFRNIYKELPLHLNRLEQLSVGRPDESKLTKELNAETHYLMRLMKKMKQTMDRTDNMEGVYVLGMIMAETQGPFNNISALMNKFSLLQRDDGRLEAKATANRNFVQQLLNVSVVLNVFIVLLLLKIFNTGTIKRLTVLMDNTRRLAERQPLNPALGGKDEIAELDRVFHEMTDAMDAAQKRERELQEVKKQLVAMVSHDLRAPLTSLQMTLSLLSSNNYGSLNEQGQIRVKSSERSVQRLIRMINDLLDLEKLEAGKMEMRLQDLPLSVVLSRSVEAVQELALSKNVKIDSDENDFEIKGDGDRLIQVIVNLLSNAVKFSPENSTIKIRTQRLKDKQIELKVIDSGPGIPESARQQIFERFRQIDDPKQESKGGTGLGLAIAKIIVEQHGGQIGVEKAEGGGSSFFMRIPEAETEIEN
ncbi:MAG: HAMP domain-containing histidine kinase [Candidatus Obscuribacterales bacterium]|nr:HAMP domain-containing histidine kinase [Candidatus Obscuribacterales bacterium]